MNLKNPIRQQAVDFYGLPASENTRRTTPSSSPSSTPPPPSRPAATIHPVAIQPLSNLVTTKPDQEDIGPSTDSCLTPTGHGPHQSDTDIDGATNLQPTANPNNPNTEASVASLRTTTPATKAISENAESQLEQKRQREAHKHKGRVPLQKSGPKSKRGIISMLKDSCQAAVSYATGWEQQDQEQQTKIENLEEEVESLKNTIWELRSSKKKALALLQLEKNTVNQLALEVAKLSLGIPQGPKDDQHFISKFTELFLSIHEWVLQNFMLTNPEQLTSLGFNIQELLQLSPVDPTNILSNHPLYVIESLVVRAIEQDLFNPNSGIMKSSMENILQYMQNSSASAEEITHWHQQTKRMIISSSTFHAQLSQQLDDLGDSIDKCLGPLADVGSKSIKRTQKLRGIIGNAADLTVDCQQQPTNFRMIWFESGKDCQQDRMCDVVGVVADNKLASGGASVGMTVSPMVIRDEAVLVKARILRQLPTGGSGLWMMRASEQLGSPTEVASEVASEVTSDVVMTP